MSVNSFLIKLLFVATAASCSLVYAKSDATIVYAADLPIIGTSEHGDYAELATLVTRSRLKAGLTPHYFLFGGASLAPSPLASFDSGSHIVDILNLIEPDAMSVTKREFSYFEDELTLRSYEAAFPFLLTNAIDKQSGNHLDGIYSSLVINKRGFSLGVISVLHPRIAEEYLLQRLIIQDPENTVIRLSQEMRKNGADAIVLLHSDYFSFIDTMLEEQTLDLAIQSEPHNNSPDRALTKAHKNNVIIDKLGTAAVIDISFISNQTELSVELVDLSSITPEPLVSKTISTYKSRLVSQLQRPIGEIRANFETTRSIVRTQESGFANLITDAMKNETGSQCALINGGIIRGNRKYAANQIFMQGDLLEELPFRTRMVVIEVTGKQIVQAIENGVSQLSENKGRFPQVAGIQFKVKADNEFGQRVSDVRINGVSVEMNSTYSMATTDYLAQGGDGFDMLKMAPRMFDKSPTAPLVSDVLARSLRSKKTVAPYIDGRIEFIGAEPK